MMVYQMVYQMVYEMVRAVLYQPLGIARITPYREKHVILSKSKQRDGGIVMM